MEAASELATITFKQPFEKLENVTSDVGPNRLLIKHVSKEQNGAYRVDLALLRGKDETNEHWSVMAEPFGRFAAPVTLVGPRGERRQNGGSVGSGPNEASAGVYFPPREEGDEVTELRVVLPIKFAPLTAKFEFKDLPMP
jgi:hypothetical protein